MESKFSRDTLINNKRKFDLKSNLQDMINC
jgi:hypothetical protein